MDIMHKACCFNGNNIEKLTGSIDIIKLKLKDSIDKAITDGFDTFYHDGSKEIDLIAAELVLFRRFFIKRGDPYQIHLIAVIPSEEQAEHWDNDWSKRYHEVLSKCDDVIILNTHYKKDCSMECKRYIVDMCDRMISIYDGISNGNAKNTILYAQQRKIEIQTISF